MADCLSLLRQYNIQKKEIVERDDLIVFDNTAWPRNARTNYTVYKSGQTAKEYYTLESLLFLLKNVGLSHPMYVQRAGNQNIPVIKFPDRRGLLAYLNGELDTSPSIDRSVHLEMGIPAPSSKRSNDEPHREAVKKPRLESEEMRADKQRLVVKLEARKEGGAITDQIRSLSDTMSVEKIAAIKAKRLAKKRQTIKTDDDIDRVADHGFLDDATHSILKNERRHRTRATVIQSSTKTFSNIFSLLQTVKAREEGKLHVDTGNKQPVFPEAKPLKPGATRGYSRYDQEKFGKEATGEFRIDTTGTYHGMTLKTMTEVASKPIPEPVHSNDKIQRQDITKPVDVPKPHRKDNRSRTPIIIVPAAATSLITIYNTRELLEDYRYIPSEDRKKAGAKKVSELVIQRKKPHPSISGQTITSPFKVIDNPLRLSPQEWKQVVAVFVAGPTWQFKGWPGVLSGGSPVDIFSKMKAFHVKFDEAKLDSNIQKWDVEVLQISKTKRHLDKASMLRFWDILERFMTKKLF